MKRFINIAVACLTLLLLIASGYAPAYALVEPFVIECNQVEYTFEDMDTLLDKINEEQAFKDSLHEMAEAAREKDADLHKDLIATLGNEWLDADARQKEYQDAYDKLATLWQKKVEEYPVAAEIWTYLKDLGYSPVVRAGILGNMMNEAGYNTLNIEWNIFDNRTGKTYYGICQWSYKYHKGAWYRNLQEQLDYLGYHEYGSIKSIMGSSYETFLALEKPEQAALSFAKNYEMCSSASYIARQKNAVVAYNYFVGE